ncbi:MAG: hypothetical protein NUV46_03355 [Nanoarchaeota archaeon]|nr:hypothetical protein [Nanoarchaeota archaeon]
MLTKNMLKQEVESFLNGKGDFVQIDHLTRYLKLMPPLEMRKFAHLKLAGIYMNKEMYPSAAESFKNAAVNTITFREKQENFLKEAKALIMALRLDESDKALKKALDEGAQSEKDKLYSEIVDFYKKQILVLEKKDKPGNLVKLCEKFMKLKTNDLDKEEVKNKLLNLYTRLGRTKDYQILKDLGRT